jgi:subfamily B ATP-binding cassette protein MsbA
MKLVVTSAANVPAVQLIAVLALAVIVYLASLQSVQDQFTVGGFVSFIGAMALLFAPLKRLTGINERLQRGLAAAESVAQQRPGVAQVLVAGGVETEAHREYQQ